MWASALRRAARLRREQGAVPALVTLASRLRRSLVRLRTVDVFRYDLAFVPDVPTPATLRDGEGGIVVGPEDARSDKPTVAALSDWDGRAPLRLERGAEALCVVVDDELAHVTWMARSRLAKKAFDTLPYPVAFAGGEACTGGILTTPRWRGWGLGVWAVACAHRYLRDAGCTAVVNAIEIHNLPSLRLHERFRPQRVARLRSLRLLGLEFGFRVAARR